MSVPGHLISEIATSIEDPHLQKLIQEKAPPETIYQLGNNFRKGLIKGYKKGTYEALENAIACYKYLCAINFKSNELYHNMGLIFYEFGIKLESEGKAEANLYYQKAFYHFSQSNLQQSKNNIEKMKLTKKIPSLDAKKTLVQVGQEAEENHEKVIAERKEVISQKFENTVEELQNATFDAVLSMFPGMLSPAQYAKAKQECKEKMRAKREEEVLLLQAKLSQIKPDIDKHLLPLYGHLKNEELSKVNQILDASKVAERDRNNQLFSSKAIEDLKRIAKGIEDLVGTLGGSEVVVIVALGASPLWFMETLKSSGFTGKILNIPISGAQGLNNVKAERIQSYKGFLASQGLDEQFLSKTKSEKKLLLIDCVASGASLVNFKKLLLEIDPKFENIVHLLGIRELDSLKPFLYDFKTMPIQEGTLNEIQAHRLGRSFHEDEWVNWKTLDFSPLTSSTIEARKQQLKDVIVKMDNSTSSASIKRSNA